MTRPWIGGLALPVILNVSAAGLRAENGSQQLQLIHKDVPRSSTTSTGRPIAPVTARPVITPDHVLVYAAKRPDSPYEELRFRDLDHPKLPEAVPSVYRHNFRDVVFFGFAATKGAVLVSGTFITQPQFGIEYGTPFYHLFVAARDPNDVLGGRATYPASIFDGVHGFGSRLIQVRRDDETELRVSVVGLVTETVLPGVDAEFPGGVEKVYGAALRVPTWAWSAPNELIVFQQNLVPIGGRMTAPATERVTAFPVHSPEHRLEGFSDRARLGVGRGDDELMVYVRDSALGEALGQFRVPLPRAGAPWPIRDPSSLPAAEPLVGETKFGTRIEAEFVGVTPWGFPMTTMRLRYAAGRQSLHEFLQVEIRHPPAMMGQTHAVTTQQTTLVPWLYAGVVDPIAAGDWSFSLNDGCVSSTLFGSNLISAFTATFTRADGSNAIDTDLILVLRSPARDTATSASLAVAMWNADSPVVEGPHVVATRRHPDGDELLHVTIGQ